MRCVLPDKVTAYLSIMHAIALGIIGGYLLSFNGEETRGYVAEIKNPNDPALHAAEFGLGMMLVAVGIVTLIILITTMCLDKEGYQTGDLLRSVDEVFFLLSQLFYLFFSNMILVVTGMLFLAKVDEEIKDLNDKQEEHRKALLTNLGISSISIAGLYYILFIFVFIKMWTKDAEGLYDKWYKREELRSGRKEYAYIDRN